MKARTWRASSLRGEPGKLERISSNIAVPSRRYVQFVPRFANVAESTTIHT
jgi:hypothetical protein